MQLVSRKNFMLLLAIAVAAAIFIIFSMRSGYKIVRVAPTDQQTMMLEKQSVSDEVEAIEEDLVETDLGDIDRELQDIEEELNQVTY